MKQKKARKRYETAQQITREIDAYRDKMARMMRQADALDDEANGYIQSGENLQLAEYRQLEAKRIRKKAYRIEHHRLPFIKRKLAEFLTIQFPGMDSDPSVSSKG